MSEGTAREIARDTLRRMIEPMLRQVKPDAPSDQVETYCDLVAGTMLHALADAGHLGHEAGALAPAGMTADSFTERDLDAIGLAVWGTSTAMTERRFVGLDLIEKLHACGFDIVRVAPAADAATGEGVASG